MFATRHNTTRSEAAPLKCIGGSTRVWQRRYLTLKVGARLFLIAALASSTASVWAVVTNIVGDSNRRGFPGTVDIVELHHGEANDEVLVMWSVPAGSGHDGFTIQGRRGGDRPDMPADADDLQRFDPRSGAQPGRHYNLD